jgi:hypothetical protein
MYGAGGDAVAANSCNFIYHNCSDSRKLLNPPIALSSGEGAYNLLLRKRAEANNQDAAGSLTGVVDVMQKGISVLRA